MESIIHRKPIHESLLYTIFSSDQSIYPAPLTFSRLKGWVETYPDLSLGYWVQDVADDSEKMAGVVVTLPIKQEHWVDLLNGQTREHEIEPSMLISDKETISKVALHVFHIEKYSTWDEVQSKSSAYARFSDVAMRDIAQIAECTKWTILGYSAMTATEEGRTCFTRLCFKPTGYKEIFLRGNQQDEEIRTCLIYPGEQKSIEDITASNVVLGISNMMAWYYEA